MNEPPLLNPGTYDVLKRVPNEWMDLQTVKEEICRFTDYPIGTVTRRLSHLVRLQLIEIRHVVAPDCHVRLVDKEVRRISW
jgi:hypothetical protein